MKANNRWRELAKSLHSLNKNVLMIYSILTSQLI
jgi:hypothetical protein